MRRHLEELKVEDQAKEHQIHQLQDEVKAKIASRRKLVVSKTGGAHNFQNFVRDFTAMNNIS